ncbi:hypothetical protein BS78_01G352600 [Paspalum vaginatum]|nr:hypothetical protein BS78_01G352600 [Paspalum vaginatum]
MMSVAVAVASLAPVSGNGGGGATMMASSPAVVEAAPLLVAARGNRVHDDQEPAEMDSEAHRRLAVLARRGPQPPHLSYGTLNANKAACNPVCSRRGEPYFPDHCKRKYHCPS